MRRREPRGPKGPGRPATRKTPGAAAVATTYMGTVVGAGFASGQEVWRFFTAFGTAGAWGILLSTGLFVFFGLAALRLGRRLGARSHGAVMTVAGGRRLGRGLDVLINCFLFGALATMMAGAGAIFADEWGLPPLLGGSLLLMAVVATVWVGLNGVVNAMNAVAPLLLGAIAGLGLTTLLREGIPLSPPATPAAAPVPWWPLSAALYVSYNLVGAVAILSPLGGAVARGETLVRGALLGGGGLGLAALGIHLSLAATLPAAAAYEVPMLHVAGRLGPAVGLAFSAVLLAEIYTTAVASLYGLAARFTEAGGGAGAGAGAGGVGAGTGAGGAGAAGLVGFRRVALFISLAALVAGQLGFSTLVGTFYPLIGAAGLVLLALLARQMLIIKI